jgi:Lar family restriction alleviation protein
MSDLKPCPFCGTDKVVIIFYENVMMYCVYCTKCGAKADIEKKRDEAIEAWNRHAEVGVDTENMEDLIDNFCRRVKISGINFNEIQDIVEMLKETQSEWLRREGNE